MNVSNTFRFALSRTIRTLLPAFLLRQFSPQIWLESIASTDSNPQVLSGPFKGMTLCLGPAAAGFHARLAGTYEMELHEWVTELGQHATSFDGHVHVGAAEGFYAVGFSRLMPGIPFVAFEQRAHSSDILETTAGINGVRDLLDLRGFANPADLEAALKPFRHPLVVMDVEGGEGGLLDPSKVPSLAKATILLEIHHWIRPGFRDELLGRMTTTHTTDIRASQPRTLEDLPQTPQLFLRLFRRKALLQLINENRGPFMEWALFRPR